MFVKRERDHIWLYMAEMSKKLVGFNRLGVLAAVAFLPTVNWELCWKLMENIRGKAENAEPQI